MIYHECLSDVFIYKRWRMFSKMFMIDMLSKMIINANVCIMYILNQNDSKKIWRVSMSNQLQRIIL